MFMFSVPSLQIIRSPQCYVFITEISVHNFVYLKIGQ